MPEAFQWSFYQHIVQWLNCNSPGKLHKVSRDILWNIPTQVYTHQHIFRNTYGEKISELCFYQKVISELFPANGSILFLVLSRLYIQSIVHMCMCVYIYTPFLTTLFPVRFEPLTRLLCCSRDCSYSISGAVMLLFQNKFSLKSYCFIFVYVIWHSLVENTLYILKNNKNYKVQSNIINCTAKLTNLFVTSVLTWLYQSTHLNKELLPTFLP